VASTPINRIHAEYVHAGRARLPGAAGPPVPEGDLERGRGSQGKPGVSEGCAGQTGRYGDAGNQQVVAVDLGAIAQPIRLPAGQAVSNLDRDFRRGVTESPPWHGRSISLRDTLDWLPFPGA